MDANANVYVQNFMLVVHLASTFSANETQH